jgi:hypothetical protein
MRLRANASLVRGIERRWDEKGGIWSGIVVFADGRRKLSTFFPDHCTVDQLIRSIDDAADHARNPHREVSAPRRHLPMPKCSVWTIGAGRSTFDSEHSRMAGSTRHFPTDDTPPKQPEEGWAGGEEEMRKGIYRDTRDRLRASPEVFPSMLADFLETDVRDDPGRCEELLNGLSDACGGQHFEAYGNHYELEAGPDGALLRNGCDDRRAPLRLAVADLRRALAAWRRAIG